MITDDIIVIPDIQAAYLKGAKAAVTFTNRDMFAEVKSPIKINTSKKAYQIVPWGSDNNLPADILEIVQKNPIGTSALDFKMDVAFGGGINIGHYDENGDFVKFTNKELLRSDLQEVKLFLEDNAINDFIGELISDIQWFNNGFVELILNQEDPAKRKIVELNVKEAFFSRWEVADSNGTVQNHCYSAKWPDTPKEEEAVFSSVLWGKNPTLELEKDMGRKPDINGKTKDNKVFRYIMPIRLPSPGKIYYPIPSYYSIIASGWLDFANAIPQFKKALMNNSVTVYYHIEIHEDYFPDIFRKEGIKNKKAQNARIKKEYEDLNSFLKGYDNAGKTMITYMKKTPQGNEPVSMIKIHVIDKKIGGEYLEDSHEANAMIYTAFRVHPNLIGVIPGKNSSNLSGSDKRELLRITQSLQARIRAKILSPLYLVKKINAWPSDVEFSIPDIILTTLDQGKEVQQVNI